MRLDAPPQVVHGVVAGDDAGSGRGHPVLQGLDRDADRVPNERAEPDYIQPRSLKRLVIRGSHFFPDLLQKRQNPV